MALVLLVLIVIVAPPVAAPGVDVGRSKFQTAPPDLGANWSPLAGNCPEGYAPEHGIVSELPCDGRSAVRGWCILDPARALEFCEVTQECCGVSETSYGAWRSANLGLYFVGACPIKAHPDWRTCRKRLTGATCSQTIALTQAIAALQSSLNSEASYATRSWGPGLFRDMLTTAEVEALRAELQGLSAPWQRPQVAAPTDVGLSAARDELVRLALETPHENRQERADGSRQLADGDPRPCMSAIPTDARFRTDRYELQISDGWTRRPDLSPVSMMRVYDQGPAEAAASGLGVAPHGMPCLRQFQEAVSSESFRHTVAAVAGLPADVIRPLRLRVYQHTAWHHFSCPHTDQCVDFINDVRGSSIDNGMRKVENRWMARSLVSVSFNLGTEEDPNEPLGLVWCMPEPRRLPSPPGSALVFRISNISIHAVFPVYDATAGRYRLTIQVVFGGPLLAGGARPPPKGGPFSSGPPPPPPPSAGRLAPAPLVPAPAMPAVALPAAPTSALDGCRDEDELLREATLSQAGHVMTCRQLIMEGAEGVRLCREGAELAERCCESCRGLWAARARMLQDLQPQQARAARLLMQAGTRFRSPPLRGDIRAAAEGMPLVALGTGGGLRGWRAEAIIEYALRTGYRHLDSAVSYASHETAIWRGVEASGVPRKEVFITTKVPPSSMGYRGAASACAERIARELPGGYADLCLLHWPQAEGSGPWEGSRNPEWLVVERAGAWRALEDARDAGTCRAIGVSNFLVKHLEELARYARILPAANQIEYSPSAPLQELVDYCHRHGIVVQAFGWLLPHVLELPKLLEVSKALGRPLVHVLLRWFLAQGISPLFKTEREERLLENAEALSDDFELSPVQVAEITQPQEDYPWSFYTWENSPWRTPAMSTFS